MADQRTVLVTGATGAVGREVVKTLLAEGVAVRALTRDPSSADLGVAVECVQGDLLDVDAVERAVEGVDGVFVLSPVAADELNATLLTLDVLDRADVRAIGYLSVLFADRFTDPPHFAAKAAAERMIVEREMPVTMLRPGYYLQNDERERSALQEGRYVPPIGEVGIVGVDVRDLGEVAARAVTERLDASVPLPPEVIDVVGPETLTGSGLADLWSRVLGHDVTYAGDDLDGLEASAVSAGAPRWFARDMRLMMERFERDGMTAAPGTDHRLQGLLKRPMRDYETFARETAASWE